MPRTWALLSLLLLGAGPAAGQTARPAACTAPEHISSTSGSASGT